MLHSDREFWKYTNNNGHITIEYHVDGQIRGSEHGAVQYFKICL